MYDLPSWKRELNRRLAAIRERVGGDLKPNRPASACTADGAGMGRVTGRRETAAPGKGKRRWQR